MKILNKDIFFRKYSALSLILFISLVFFISLYDIIKLGESVNLIFDKIKSLSLNSNNNQEEIGEIKYVFIDLGANKGDSIYNFVGMNNRAQGGNINSETFPQSFKSAKWIIYGLEANSIFDEPLLKMKEEVEKLNHTVHLYKSTAAWTYDGTIDFYLDTVNDKFDYWGSSLNKNHVILFYSL
jgi:hypothetical protein